MAKSRFASCSNFGTVNNKTSTNKKSRYSSVGILGSVSDKAATDYQAANQKELEKVWNDTFFNMLKPENGRLPNADTLARKMGYRNDTERQEYKKNNPEIYEAMGGIKCVGDSEKVLTNNLFQTNELKQLAKERLINRFNNADTAELSKIIDTLNSGEWQKADTMEKYSKKVNTYVNDYIALNELGYFNSVPEAKRKSDIENLTEIKKHVNSCKDVFSKYENKDDYLKDSWVNKYSSMTFEELKKAEQDIKDDLLGKNANDNNSSLREWNYVKNLIESQNKDVWDKFIEFKKATTEEKDNILSRVKYGVERYKEARDYIDISKKSFENTEDTDEYIAFVKDWYNKNGTTKGAREAYGLNHGYFDERGRYQRSSENCPQMLDYADTLAFYETKYGSYSNMLRLNELITEYHFNSVSSEEFLEYYKEMQTDPNANKYIEKGKEIYKTKNKNISDDEYDVVCYYLGKGDKENYYFTWLEDVVYEREVAASSGWSAVTDGVSLKYHKLWSDYVKQAPVEANALSVLLNFGSGAEFVYNTLNGNVQENKLSKASSKIREAYANTHDFMIGDYDLHDFLYSGAMSMIDSFLASYLPGQGGAVTLALSAAAAGVNDALSRGMSNEQALWNGLASGAFEYLCEKYSIGSFKSLKQSDGAGLKTFLLNLSKTMLVNAGEEVATEISNIIYDYIVNKELSNYELSINQYIDMGLSEAEARSKAKEEVGMQIREAAASGAFIGFGFGVVGTAHSARNASKYGRYYYGFSKNRVNALIEQGLAMPDGTSAKNSAIKADAQFKGGKNLSGTTLYNLATKIKSEIETKGVARLAELGESKSNIKVQAPLIAEYVFEGRLTDHDLSILNNSKYANSVVEELSSDRVNTIWRNAVENSRVGNSKNMQNAELHSDAYNSNNNDIYLLKSNGGETKQGQPFNIDLSQVKLKYQDTYKRAIESGYFNNTQQTHEFIQMLAEISADKGINFEFTDNEKVNNSGFAIKEKAVNGYVTRGTITLNVNSAKPFNSLVGHEITHVLERTRNFGDLNSLILKYAKQKGDYESRLAALTELYENAEGADVNKELVADLVGDYLFTDIDFVRRLFNENRNLFQRIYDEIMYLYRIVAAGSIEELQLEIIKKTFEEVYRESENVEKIAENSDVKYSIIKTSKMPYPEQLQLIEKRQINGSNSLYIGEPSQQLQKVGLSEAPFAMNQSDYRKSRRAFGNNKNYSSHAVPYEFFENMPQYFADAPLLIDKGNKVSIITLYPMNDTKGQASYVIGGVWQNQQMENDTVNLVKSVYPLDDFVEKISRAAEEGKLVVINKNKAEQMLATIGIQSSKVSRIVSLAKHTISQKAQSVNTGISENGPAYSDSFINRDTYKKAAESGGNLLDLGLSEPAITDIAHMPTAEESIAASISGEQLDIKQRRILDFAEKHFPHITVKFSGNMTKNGLWDSDSKTLLLNINQTVAGMYTEVFKHEFMHTLESKRLYQEFKQFLFNKDTAFVVWAKVQCKTHGIELSQYATAKEAINALCDYYYTTVKNDMTIAKKYRDAFTVDGAQREMVADFFGEIMFNGEKYRTQTAQALADETFLTLFDKNEIAEFEANSMAALAEISENEPNIFKQIVDWVKRLILKLRGTRIKADAILADELERNIKMLEDYVKQVYNSRETKKIAENGGVEFKKSLQNNYDYSKSFAQQIDDYKSGKIPNGDTLLVGATPELFLSIGFNALPMTMNTTHVDYALNGTKDIDHHLGEEMLKQLPESIKEPIAIFISQTKGNTSVVALLNFEVNGKQTVASIVIDGFGFQNKIRIDSNAITSVYGKGSAINRLYQAAQDEANDKFSLLYANKKEADSLLQSAGHQLSGGLIPHDGFYHSIRENGSPVKSRFNDVTETQQFKRWFGDWQKHQNTASKIVDKSGKPLVMYYVTDVNVTEFNTDNQKTNGELNFGKGIYLTPNKNLAEKHTTTGKVMSLYVDVKNPYEIFSTRLDDFDLKKLSAEFDESVTVDNIDKILRKKGYDGIIVRDHNRTTNPINQVVVFNSNQVKSATDNIGTFDANNGNIKFATTSQMQQFRYNPETYRESENVEKIAENSDVKYSIIKTSKMPYPEQLQLIEKRQINGSNSLYIGEPSQQLQKVGLSEAPFAMNQSDYRKSRRAFGNNKNYSSHAVPYEFFENMPKYFADAPLLIDKGNKVSIITLYPMNDTKGQASYVIGGVWQNQQMENDTVNLVKSVYPLDDFVSQIAKAAETGSLVIINKNKAEQMLATIGIQPSKVSHIVSLSKHTISQKAQSVNTGISENDTFSDVLVSNDPKRHAQGEHQPNVSNESIYNFETKVKQKQSDIILENDDVKQIERGNLESYTETQYNNFGWVRYNDVLSAKEYSVLLSRYADYKHNKDNYPTTRFGEAVIFSFDYPNILMYVKGAIRSPQITKVLTIDSELPLITQGTIQKEILSNERKQLLFPYETVTDLFGEGCFAINKKRDFSSFQEYNRRSKREFSGEDNTYHRNKQNGTRGGITSKTFDKSEYIKRSDRDTLGNTLTEAQQSYFADSKVRDENGNLKVMYHGTPNATFTYKEYNRLIYKKPIKVSKQDWAEVNSRRTQKYAHISDENVPVLDLIKLAEYNRINEAYSYVIRNIDKYSFNIVSKRKIKSEFNGIYKEESKSNEKTYSQNDRNGNREGFNRRSSEPPRYGGTIRENVSEIRQYSESEYDSDFGYGASDSRRGIGLSTQGHLQAVDNDNITGQNNFAENGGGVKYSFAGYAEDGKGMYKSNFPKGTPKIAKAQRILSYIQDVWSKKPIKLNITDNEGNIIKTIDAQFDPTYENDTKIVTDASKLMGGNRHGSASEQRVTLDLADDYYQIASESKYNYSKSETGKNKPTHDGVREWHYFVNDIYFAEYDSNVYKPYTVSINVKEKPDGNFVYSFSAEKQKENSTQQTLHAVVSEEIPANAKLFKDIISEDDMSVNTSISENDSVYSDGFINREAYYDKLRSRQAFDVDLSQIEERYRDTYKKAVESGILNNTKRTHELVDMIAKISADKGVRFDFVNNEKISKSGFAADDKIVNGYLDENGNIVINIDSSKVLESTVGHEITHILEGTELYAKLEAAITEYAIQKGEYDNRLAALTELYKNVEGADVSKELVADLVGDYLFNDSEFIHRLSTEHRNIFEKIFDEIKYLLRIVTAGSKEARQLEKVKKAFENAYRESVKVQKNTADEGVVSYSIGFSEENNTSETRQIISLINNSMEKISDKQVFEVAYENSIENFSKKTDYVMEVFNEQGNIVYNSVIGDVELAKSGAKSTIMQGFGREKLAAIKAIKPVIENGEVISKVTNYKNTGVDRYIIAAKGVINGENAIVGVVVKSYPGKAGNSKFYLHEAEIIKTGSPVMTAPQLSVDTVSKSVSDYTVPRKVQSVNISISENFGNDTKNILPVKNSISNKKAIESGILNNTIFASDTDIRYSDRDSFTYKEYNKLLSKKPIKVNKEDWSKVNSRRTQKYAHISDENIPVLDLIKLAEYNRINEAYGYVIRNIDKYSFSIISKMKVISEKSQVLNERKEIYDSIDRQNVGNGNRDRFDRRSSEPARYGGTIRENVSEIRQSSESEYDSDFGYGASDSRRGIGLSTQGHLQAVDNDNETQQNNTDDNKQFSVSADENRSDITPETSSAYSGSFINRESDSVDNTINKFTDEKIDFVNGVDYNNKRGENYVRTDEFRSLQAQCQGMSDEDIQLYRSGDKQIDEKLRENIAGVLRGQIQSYRNGLRYDYGILNLSAQDNQFNLYQNVDGALFHDVFETARFYLRNGELVDLHTVETTEDGIGYNDCYNYLSEDGLSGFSITPDGDLISVFNASGKGGFLSAIAPFVKANAKTLDCYNSPKQPLSSMYGKKFGFKTASVMDYNMEYDHDNIAKNHNKPQVAFMVNTDADVKTRHFTETQYDEAKGYRDSFVNQEVDIGDNIKNKFTNEKIDFVNNVEYNNKRGENYVRTDEFRNLQAECKGMSDEDIQLYHSGNKQIDDGLRERFSRSVKSIFLEPKNNGVSNDKGLLNLTAKNNNFNMHEGVDGSLFHDVFEMARNHLKFGELVDLHEIETTNDGIGYNDCYNYLSEDGLSGFSITPDGDLISVFNASGKNGFLRAISQIVKEKSKTLDCYASENQNLMEIYSAIFGFKTASVMDYNMEYDHDNIAENHSKPQVAFMLNTDADVETRHFTETQYDEAKGYRDSFVNQEVNIGDNIKNKFTNEKIDFVNNVEYNNKRGENYVRTDEFRSLQAESQRMSDEDSQLYHSGERRIDSEVRGRLSGAFGLELRSSNSKRIYSVRTLLNPKTNNNVNIIEGVDGSLFRDIFEISRKYLKNGELVDLHTVETTEDGIGYNDCYNYLSEDGLSGFSVTPDGDLISVFNLSAEKGFLKTIAPIVTQKAKTLDCYASPKQNLMTMYERILGFKTASVMDYNTEYDHDNIAKNHNKPQVAFMVNSDADVKTRYFTETQYDEAKGYRDSFVNKKADIDSSISIGTRKDSGSQINSDQKKAIEKLCKKLGRKVEFEDLRNISDSNGNTVSPDGYIKDGVIHLNLYAENPIGFIFKHELTHFGENTSGYARFKQQVKNSKLYKNWLCEKTGESDVKIAEYIYKKRVVAAQSEIYSINDPKVEAEIISDFAGDMLFTENGSGMASIIGDMNVKHRNAFVRFIVDFISYIKKKLSGQSFITFQLSVLEDSFNRMLSEASDLEKRGIYNYGNDISYCFAVCKDSARIGMAEKLEGSGEDYRSIFLQTGLIRDPFGFWLFEMDTSYFRIYHDANAGTVSHYLDYKLKWDHGVFNCKLGDIVSYKELYDNYPQLKELKVTIQDSSNPDDTIRYIPGRKALVINKRLWDSYETNKNEFRAIMMSALQRLIQYLDGRNSNIDFDTLKEMEANNQLPYTDLYGRSFSAEEAQQYLFDNYEADMVEKRQRAKDSLLHPRTLSEIQNMDEYLPITDYDNVIVPNGEGRLVTLKGDISQKLQRYINQITNRYMNADEINLAEIDSTDEVLGFDRCYIPKSESDIEDTPNRNEIRQGIIKRLLKHGSAVIGEKLKAVYNGFIKKERRADIVLGLPSANSSTALVTALSAENSSRIIDENMVKEWIPEYDKARYSEAVLQEGRLIADEIMKMSAEKGENIVNRITADNYKAIVRVAEYLKSKGYTVYIHLDETPTGTVIGEALKKYLNTGEVTPMGVIARCGEKTAKIFNRLIKNANIADGYTRSQNYSLQSELPSLGDQTAVHLQEGQNTDETDNTHQETESIENEEADTGSYYNDEELKQQSETALRKNRCINKIKKFLFDFFFTSTDSIHKHNIIVGSDDLISDISKSAKQAAEYFSKDRIKKLSETVISTVDTIGRKLSKELKKTIAKTCFKNENGEPVSFYILRMHGVGGFKRAKLGLVAGTLESVINEYNQMYKDGTKPKRMPIIEEIFVNMENVLVLPFTPVDLTIENLHYLVEKNIMTQSEYDALMKKSVNINSSKYDGFISKKLREYLKKAGYEGIMFYNNTTDVGSMSVVIFDENQMVTVSKNGELQENCGVVEQEFDIDSAEDRADSHKNSKRLKYYLNDYKFNRRSSRAEADPRIQLGHSSFMSVLSGSRNGIVKFIKSVIAKTHGIALSGTDTAGGIISQSEKASFGDTVFKDADGNLLSLYLHGTSDIDIEKAVRGGMLFSNFNDALEEWLSKKEKTALTKYGIIHEYHINMVNPLVIKGNGWDSKLIADRLLRSGVITKKEYYNLFSNAVANKKMTVDGAIAQRLIECMKMKKFDGIIFIDEKGRSRVMVFDTYQVKLVSKNGISVENSDAAKTDVSDSIFDDNYKVDSVVIDSERKIAVDTERLRDELSECADNTQKMKTLTEFLMCKGQPKAASTEDTVAGHSGIFENLNLSVTEFKYALKALIKRAVGTETAETDLAGRKISEPVGRRLNNSIFKDRYGRPYSLFCYNTRGASNIKNSGTNIRLTTLKAAHDIALEQNKQNRNVTKGVYEEYYPVAKSPYQVMLDCDDLTTELLAKSMYDEGIINDIQYESVMTRLESIKGASDKNVWKTLTQALEANGFDCIVFNSKLYDRGSKAVIVFHKKQLIPVAKNGISVDDDYLATFNSIGEKNVENGQHDLIDKFIQEYYNCYGYKKYAFCRPPYIDGLIEAVWELAKDPITGKVYDPSGVEIIWSPGQPRNWEMGHISDEEYKKVHELYMEGKITDQELENWFNDPHNYRPELPMTNRNHKYESKL